MSSHVSKNIFWLTFSRIAALVLLLVAYRKLNPYLGPFGSGQYNFVLSYVLIFATIVDFGVQQLITKKISEKPEDAKKYFQNFFSFEIVISSILYLLLVGIASFRHYDSAVFYAICLAGLGMVANALTYPYLAVMAAYQDLRKVAWINFFNSLVNITIILLAVFFHHYIVFLASIQLIFGILDLTLYRFFVRKHLPNPQVLKAIFRLDLGLIKNILVQAWPFTLLVGFSAIYNRIDVIIITFLKGYEQAGYYATAYKIFDLLGFFPSVVSYTLFPFFASLMAKNSILEVRQNLEKYLRLMLAVALPLAFGGMILARQLIFLITDSDPRFIPAITILQILIWAPALLFIYIPLNSLIISQLTKKAMAITGLNVLVNVAGNLILIPHYGIKAAAIMTVVSESWQGILYFYLIRSSITDFDFFKFVWKPLLSSAVMFAVLWLTYGHSLPIMIALGAGTYFIALLITGFLTKEDISFIKNLFGQN